MEGRGAALWGCGQGWAGAEHMGEQLEPGQRGLFWATQGRWAHYSTKVCLGAPTGHRCQSPTPAGLQEKPSAPIHAPNPQDSKADLLQGEGCS